MERVFEMSANVRGASVGNDGIIEEGQEIIDD